MNGRSLLDAKAKVACADCNNGWMNGLEAGVRNFLPRMIRERGARLRRRQQTALAAWTVKTAMMMQCTHPKADQQVIPPTDYEALYRQREPSAMMRVWLGRMDEVPLYASNIPGKDIANPVEFVGIPHAANYVDENGSVVASDRAYVVTLRIGYFIGQIVRIGPIGPPEIEAKVSPGRLRSYLLPIWPAHGVRDWPPTSVKGLHGFNMLANALAPHDPVPTGWRR